MLKKLEELENIIDEYMEANNILESKRESLLESVLLWKGYAAWDTCWEYKSTEENRAFCAYLQKEHPLLANYFGGGGYIVDKNGETIDLSYMLGINKALNNRNGPYAYITAGMIGDRGMYNAYLEACRQQRGQGTGEALDSFLRDFMDGRYDQYYNDYYDVVDDDLRYRYCGDAGIKQDTMSVAEQNEEVIKGSIAGQMQDQGEGRGFLYKQSEGRAECPKRRDTRMDGWEHDARGREDSRRRSEDNGGGRGLCLARERLKRNASSAGSGTDQCSRCLYEEPAELDP